MTDKIFSCTFYGLDCKTIEVEADISNGLPMFSIVGLGDTSVQESRERIRSSIKNAGANFPQLRKTVNLAPAPLKKHGSLFDLPIAIALLVADKQIPITRLKNAVIIGELSLGGDIKSVHGVLPITHHAKKHGFTKIFLPAENAKEAAFIPGIQIIPIKSLAQLIAFAKGKIEIVPTKHISPKTRGAIKNPPNILGLEIAKRALKIAAAGHHNLLLTGPPGCGKTILARSIKYILSPMSTQEILETTKIFSIAGLLDDQPLITARPLREVHHTASAISITGGGANIPKPGEISLAHNGVLLLDEIAEFNRFALEALRQPLEDRYININRANFSTRFPCNFILLATMNPCKCGHYGTGKCICSDAEVRQYQKRISGPLLDRFDLFVTVEKTKIHEIYDNFEYEKIRNYIIGEQHQIVLANKTQKKRFRTAKIRKNSDMELRDLQEHCTLDQKSQQLLAHATQKMELSNRGYLRTIRIARTIADLEQSPGIKYEHISEALQFRNREL